MPFWIDVKQNKTTKQANIAMRWLENKMVLYRYFIQPVFKNTLWNYPEERLLEWQYTGKKEKESES